MKNMKQEEYYDDFFWADEPAWKVLICLLIQFAILFVFLPIILVALGLSHLFDKLFEVKKNGQKKKHS